MDLFSIGNDGSNYQANAISRGGSGQASLLDVGGEVYGLTGNTTLQAFKIGPLLTDFEYLKEIEFSPSGSAPNFLLRHGSWFYGTVSRGEDEDSNGWLYRVKPDGTKYQILHEFDQTGNEVPASSLIIQDGRIWGATHSSGAFNGYIYSMNLDGTDYQQEAALNSDNRFQAGTSTFAFANDHFWWIGHRDEIYRFNHQTHLVEEVFEVESPTRISFSKFIIADNVLWGLTDTGRIFSFSLQDLSYSEVYDFSGDPSNPSSPYGITVHQAGNLYGATTYGGDGAGTLFKFEIGTGTFSVLHEFSPEEGRPMGTLTIHENQIFGRTNGSPSQSDGYGIVYSVNLDNNVFEKVRYLPPGHGGSKTMENADTGLKVYDLTDFPGVLDSLALVAFYDATGGPNWTTTTNWLSGDLESWHGVTVTDGRVTKLSLINNNLAGALNEELGDLHKLEELNLPNNHITGSFPASLSNCTSLTKINMLNNDLSGNLPLVLFELTNLRRLSLGQNDFSGPIPAQIANLPNAWRIDLQGNDLTGEIPPEIGTMSSLSSLILGGNELSGTIPPELGNLSSLFNLFLDANNLTGTIPDELGNLSNLGYLYLSQNELSGSIPTALSQLTNLRQLVLYENNLTGEFPSELTSLTLLNEIAIANNSMTGAILDVAVNFPNLSWLAVNGNDFTGSVPQEVGNLTDLSYLILADNNFTGTLPSTMANLVNLQALELQGNQFTGSLPDLTTASNMGRILINDNQFDDLPDLTSLTNLSRLEVENNNFTFEDILPNASVLTSYHPQNRTDNEEVVALADGASHSMSVTDLSTGNVYQWYHEDSAIPGATSASYNLVNFQLADMGDYTCEITNPGAPDLTLVRNAITIVPEPAVQDSLALVAFYHSTNGDDWTNNSNWLTGDLDTWFGVTVESGRVTELMLNENGVSNNGNNLTGEIPSEIGDLTALRTLWLDANRIGGILPKEVGNLSSLEHLLLEYNDIGGSIPSTITQLSNLKILALRGNLLTGRIPPDIGNLQELRNLRLGTDGTNNYRNNLTGGLPAGLWTLPELGELHLSNNQYLVQGPLPAEIGNLTNLGELICNEVGLQGELPATLGNLTKLGTLQMEDNSLTGQLPSSFGKLVNLTWVELRGNQFSGNLPSGFGNLHKLGHFGIEGSNITGTFYILPSLNSVDIRGNNFDKIVLQGGASPTSLLIGDNKFTFADLESLSSIITNAESQKKFGESSSINLQEGDDLSLSPLTEFGFNDTYQWKKDNVNLPGKTHATLSINDVTTMDQGSYQLQVTNSLFPSQKITSFQIQVNIGPLPRDLDSLALVALYNATGGQNWTNNTGWLAGTLDTWFGITLKNDRVAEIHLGNNTGNNLVGSIPAEIGDLNQLTFLDLSDNGELSGPLPREIGKLEDLRILFISECSLTGAIPPEIGQLRSLTSLSLAINNISGLIPPEIGDLPLLTSLTLFANNLTGAIPPELGNLTQLTFMSLTLNDLSGTVPSTFQNFTSIRSLRLHGNNLTEFPDLSNISTDPNYKLTLHNNRLGFNSLEPHSQVVTNLAQQAFGTPEIIRDKIGNSVTLAPALPSPGTADQYQWQKDGLDIAGATNKTLVITNLSNADKGTYKLIISSSLVNGTTLQSHPIEVQIAYDTDVAITGFIDLTTQESAPKQVTVTLQNQAEAMEEDFLLELLVDNVVVESVTISQTLEVNKILPYTFSEIVDFGSSTLTEIEVRHHLSTDQNPINDSLFVVVANTPFVGEFLFEQQPSSGGFGNLFFDSDSFQGTIEYVDSDTRLLRFSVYEHLQDKSFRDFYFDFGDGEVVFQDNQGIGTGCGPELLFGAGDSSGTFTEGDYSEFTLVIKEDVENTCGARGDRIFKVTRINRTPESINLSTTSIHENQDAGSTVSSIETTDSDYGENFTYILSGADMASFEIGGTHNNELLSVGTFDYETRTSYDITITSTDGAGESVSEDFTISIENVNEAPENISIDASSFPEDIASGSSVTTMSATDPEGHDMTFSLSGTDANAFEIGGTDNDELVTSQAFDYEAESTYEITITASNNDGTSSSEDFTLTVENVNEAPEDIELSTSSFPEDIASGSSVTTISATDPEDQDITFSIFGTDAVAFDIGGMDRNELLTNQLFDYETDSIFEITLTATDSDGATTSEDFTLLIENVNEAPDTVTVSGTSFAENLTLSTSIATITASDPENQDVIFSLSGQDSLSFQIGGVNNDELLTNQHFDYETDSTFAITLTATDTDGESTSMGFTLNITDINEAPDSLSITANAIEENAAMGTIVGTFSSVDPEGLDITYSLRAGLDSAAFSVAGDQLLSTRIFDFESKTNYAVIITAADPAGLTITDTLDILVVNVNEAPTNVALSNYAIDESEVASTIIGTFSSVDPDGDQTTYTLVTDTAGYFGISGDELQLATNVDLTDTTTFGITVEAADDSGLTLEKDFEIMIYARDESTEEPLGVAIVQDFKIYPNPTTGTFQLQVSNYEQGSLRLSDLTGREIPVQLTQKGNTVTIDLLTAKAGIYLLEFRADNRWFRKRISVIRH